MDHITEQMQLLWAYQSADMEADALEREIRTSPNRQTLMRNRDFLMEQQNTIRKIEADVLEMTDRVDVIKDAVKRLEEQLAAFSARIKDSMPEDLEQTRALLSEAQKLMGSIVSFEQEMSRIRKDAGEREKQEQEVRVSAARVKMEYDKLKVSYEVEYKEQMKKLEQKRRAALEKTKGIDPALIERYRAIKLHCVPPIARLIGDQCGGCNMSQPSVTLRKIRGGSVVVECETCGRMLFSFEG